MIHLQKDVRSSLRERSLQIQALYNMNRKIIQNTTVRTGLTIQSKELLRSQISAKSSLVFKLDIPLLGVIISLVKLLFSTALYLLL